MRIGPAIFIRDVVSTQDNGFFLLFQSVLSVISGPLQGSVSGMLLREGYVSLNAKGVSLMAIFSLADGCRMLAIDSKTLRRWLERSHLSVQPHPLDARLRCVTLEQLHQLAAVHHRTLSEGHGLHLQPDAPSLSPPTDIMSLSAGANDGRHPSDLSTQLADLQTHITTLQHQLALLDFPGATRAGMANERSKVVGGQVPGICSGQIPGVFPGQVLEVFPGQVPEIFPGQVPGICSGQIPGVFPGQIPEICSIDGSTQTPSCSAAG